MGVWTDPPLFGLSCIYACSDEGKNHVLGQYGAEPHYSTLPFWQLCALKG